jgi:hypothetical protein
MDPDPVQNVTDPEHCQCVILIHLNFGYISRQPEIIRRKYRLRRICTCRFGGREDYVESSVADYEDCFKYILPKLSNEQKKPWKKNYFMYRSVPLCTLCTFLGPNGTRNARCHFRAQKCLDFRAHPFKRLLL